VADGATARAAPFTSQLQTSPMTQDESFGLVRSTKELLDGHFLLRSGLHSRQFFQCARC